MTALRYQNVVFVVIAGISEELLENAVIFFCLTFLILLILDLLFV